MISSIVAFALLLSPTGVRLDTPIVSVDVKPNEVISGQRHFRVSVMAQSPITQVEFYVGSDIRSQDTSVPYEFDLDTIAEAEGPLKLTFAAYTSDGGSAKKVISVVIDNGVSKGADFFVDRGNAFLTDSKWDEAMVAARIALKAKPKYNPARIILARANLGKGVLDKAQQIAEDVVAAEPNNLSALELLSVIDLRKAFNTVNRGGDSKAILTTIENALKGAVTARRTSLDARVDNFGPVTDANRLQFVDLAITAGRYSLAISALELPHQQDQTNVAIADRLALAQIKAGRFNDAVETLQHVKLHGSLDAYGSALVAVLAADKGDDAASDDAIKEAVLNDSDNLGVKTAQAYVALKRNKTGVLGKLTADLEREESQRTEVNYYLSALTNRLARFSDSRKYYERAILIEPTNVDMYLEQANESIFLALGSRLDKKDADVQIETARIMFSTALIAKPDSYQALTGMSIVYMIQQKVPDAVRFGEAAIKAGPNYPAAHYALSAAYTDARKPREAQDQSLLAGKLDKVNLEGRQIPNAVSAWNYFATFGRTPVLVLPTKSSS